MKDTIQTLLVSLALLALSTINSQLSTARAQGTTAFTYQGRLNTGTNAANGSYDMTFAVYDANVAGNQIAGPITNSAVAVSNGLFTVTLDFGAGVFTGTNYWVQMAVSPAGASTFATLVPRQQLTPAPYALSALVSPQANALCPPGAVIAFCGINIPTGWLLCDGSAVSRTTYARLFSAIGTAWGAGDGSRHSICRTCAELFCAAWTAVAADRTRSGDKKSHRRASAAIRRICLRRILIISLGVWVFWATGWWLPNGGIINAGYNGFPTES